MDLAVSPAGTLIYTTGSTLGSRRAIWVSRDGTASPVDPSWDPQGSIQNAELSPDGKAMAVELIGAANRISGSSRSPTGPFSRITFGDTANVRPAWSPDGREVYYIQDRSGTGTGAIYAASGGRNRKPRQLIASKADFAQILPSRDGRWLLVRTPLNAARHRRGHPRLPTGDTTAVPLIATPAAEGYPALSPDGRWLAYSSDRIRNPGDLCPALSGDRDGKVAGLHRRRHSAAVVQQRPGAVLHQWKERHDVGRGQPGTDFLLGEQRVLFSTAPYSTAASIQAYS